MDRWPYEVKTYTPVEVREYCVENEWWQRRRLSMKGISTKSKLLRLEDWRNICIENEGAVTRECEVQIDNYINALKRGGQLRMDLTVQR